MSPANDPSSGVTDDQAAINTPASESSPTTLRRRWHTPKFMLTEIALTDNQGSIVTDTILGQS